MALLDMFNSATNWYQANPFVSQVAVPGALSLYNQYQQGSANNQATGQLVGGYQQGLDALYDFYNTGRGDITAGRDMGLEQLGSMYGQSREDLLYGRDQGLAALQGGLEQGVGAVSGAASAGVSAAQGILGATRKDVAPYQAHGRQGLSEYQNLLADPNAITQSTDYQFRVGQGQQALERAQAAKGMSLSGNTLTGIAEYGQEFGTRELDAALARRQNMINTGAQANELAGQVGSSVASTIGGLRSTEASSLGNLYRGFGSDMGNLYSSTGNNLANLSSSYGLNASNLYAESGRGLAEMTGQFAPAVASTMANIGGAQAIGTGAGADIRSGGLRDIGNILDKVAGAGSAAGAGAGVGAIGTAGASAVGASGMGMAGTGAVGAGATLGTMASTPLSAGVAGQGMAAMAPGGQGLAAMFPGAQGAMATGAGATGTAGSAGATTSGAGAAASGLLTSLGIGAALIGGMKLLSGLDGGANDKTKTTKLFKDFDNDPAAGYQRLDKVITGDEWKGETNTNIQYAINPAFEKGVINASYPTLHSANSEIDLWSNPQSNLSPMAIAQSYGLGQEQAQQYAALQKERAAATQDNYEANRQDQRGPWNKQRPRDAIEYDVRQFEASYFSPQAKQQSAQTIYSNLRQSGYQGDLTKLEQYLGQSMRTAAPFGMGEEIR